MSANTTNALPLGVFTDENGKKRIRYIAKREYINKQGEKVIYENVIERDYVIAYKKIPKEAQGKRGPKKMTFTFNKVCNVMTDNMKQDVLQYVLGKYRDHIEGLLEKHMIKKVNQSCADDLSNQSCADDLPNQTAEQLNQTAESTDQSDQDQTYVEEQAEDLSDQNSSQHESTCEDQH